jgi:hypothetical protein
LKHMKELVKKLRKIKTLLKLQELKLWKIKYYLNINHFKFSYLVIIN